METAAKASTVHPVVVAVDGTATATQHSDKKVHPSADPKAERKPARARQDDRWKIFSGTANDALSREICDFLGMPLGQTHISKFSDGETYVQIMENVRGADVFLVQPTCDPVDLHLMQLLLLIDALKRASARRI